jgi:hypothetical protein
MDIVKLVTGVTKLADYAASGIGSVAGPMLAAWKARREANAKLIVARGEVEAQRILAEGQAQTMQIIAHAQADARATLVSPDATVQGQLEFGAAVNQRIQFQEEKRQSNIVAVIGQAAQELGDREVQDHEVDHDWTARFFSDVQDVSSEELQLLWAKVLAAEVERPGSTSTKTLSILKDMSKRIAHVFSWFCNLCVYSERALYADEARICSKCFNLFTTRGFHPTNLNLLNEHGLVNPDYDSWHDMQPAIGFGIVQPDQTNRYPFRFQGQYWVLYPIGGPRSIKPRSPGFPLYGAALTRSGLELSKVVQLDSLFEDYKTALIDYFAQEGLQMTPVDNGDLHVGPLYISEDTQQY